MLTLNSAIRELSYYRFVDDLECHYDEPLAPHTTMKMQSEAALLAVAHTPRSLRDALKISKQYRIPALLLGGGSNTLFVTSRFDGVVIKMGEKFQTIELIEPDLIRCGGGFDLKKALSFSMECGLSGLEFATGIPGSVGGAAAGNAGARDNRGGKERELGICDCIERLLCMDKSGGIWDVNRGEFQYAYRASELRQVIVLEMDLRLRQAPAEEIHKNRVWFVEKRKGQPFNLPSCGCVFKNPAGINPGTGKPYTAGKIIDDLGLKGYRIGGAEISEGHANIMVNRSRASGEDFLALIALTRDQVRQNMNLDLDLEVKIIGGPSECAWT